MQDLSACVIRVCSAAGETFGTGFVVTENLAITCAHVVAACSSSPGGNVRIVFHANGEARNAEVLADFWCAPDADDIAVLRIEDGTPKGIPIACLGKTIGIQGHHCSAFGYPKVGTLQGIEGRGSIYKAVSESNGQRLLQLSSGEITAGFSGGPLLDEESGRVVGLVTAIAEPDSHWRLSETAFATPSEALYQLILPLCPDLQLYPPQEVEDYLAAMRDYCANLPYLTLYDIRPPKMLNEVYVPLKARPQPRKGEKDDIDEESTMLDAHRSEPLSIEEVIQDPEHLHVLILGEPGAGKSTLLRQLAERSWDAPQKIGLDLPHLPILVPLRRLAGTEGSLEERLNRALTSELMLRQQLPDGFFTEWPTQTGAHWLILLDALDEVLTDERDELIQWLKNWFKSIGQNRIIITARPSGYSLGELDEKVFGHYDLLPFTPEQTGEFARKWFSNKADQFLGELERVRVGDLRGTPLLLTIAAKVYLEKGTLPERRSALYGQFVDIWLIEAEKRGLKVELGERICKIAPFIFARLALAMTELPKQVSEATLSRIVATHLHDALHISKEEAEIDATRFVRVMARRSGVFTRRGNEYDFVHPTFQEYYAASELLEMWRTDVNAAWAHIVSSVGIAKNWIGVVIFLIDLFGENMQDLRILKDKLARIGRSGIEYAELAAVLIQIIDPFYAEETLRSIGSESEAVSHFDDLYLKVRSALIAEIAVIVLVLVLPLKAGLPEALSMGWGVSSVVLVQGLYDFAAPGLYKKERILARILALGVFLNACSVFLNVLLNYVMPIRGAFRILVSAAVSIPAVIVVGYLYYRLFHPWPRGTGHLRLYLAFAGIILLTFIPPWVFGGLSLFLLAMFVVFKGKLRQRMNQIDVDRRLSAEALDHLTLEAQAREFTKVVESSDELTFPYGRALALRNRASMFIQLGQYDKAENDLSAASKLAPQHPYLFLRFAELYLEQGWFHQAIIAAQDALARKRRFAPAQFVIAVALLMTGQAETGLVALRTYIAWANSQEIKQAIEQLEKRRSQLLSPSLDTALDMLRETNEPAKKQVSRV